MFQSYGYGYWLFLVLVRPYVCPSSFPILWTNILGLKCFFSSHMNQWLLVQSEESSSSLKVKSPICGMTSDICSERPSLNNRSTHTYVLHVQSQFVVAYMKCKLNFFTQLPVFLGTTTIHSPFNHHYIPLTPIQSTYGILITSSSGWWFATWILFFHILGMSSSQLPTD